MDFLLLSLNPAELSHLETLGCAGIMKMKPCNNAYCGVTLLSKSFISVLAPALCCSSWLANLDSLVFLVYVGHHERTLEYIHRAQSCSNRKCARVCEKKTNDNVKFLKGQTVEEKNCKYTTRQQLAELQL